MHIWHEEALQQTFRCELGKQDTKRYYHWHEYLEILLIMTDGVECLVEGKQCRFSRGELLLFSPYSLHCVYCDQPGGAEVCLIQCREDMLQNSMYSPASLREKHLLRCDLPQLHSALMQTADFFLHQPPQKNSSPLEDWIRMLANLLCIYGKAETTSSPGTPDYRLHMQKDMMEICKYITEHVQTKLRVPELAAQAGYSAAHFSRLFQKTLGCGPGEYITKVKVREAQRMLRSSDVSVTEVSYHLGFSNPNNFARSYRRILGHPPSEDRGQGKKTSPRIPIG